MTFGIHLASYLLGFTLIAPALSTDTAVFMLMQATFRVTPTKCLQVDSTAANAKQGIRQARSSTSRGANRLADQAEETADQVADSADRATEQLADSAERTARAADRGAAFLIFHS